MRISKRWKRGRQRWTADIIDHTGARVQKLFETREAAEEWASQQVLTARTKTAPDLPATISYKDFSARALAVRTHLKPRTRDSYAWINAKYLLPVFGATPLRNLRRTAVRAFLAEQREAFAKNTVRLMFATLHLVLAEAVEADLVTANPLTGLGRKLDLRTKKAARQEETKSKAMTRTQRDTFLATA